MTESYQVEVIAKVNTAIDAGITLARADPKHSTDKSTESSE